MIIDELAHSNVHGSRNLKRYQDVLELLAAGINVYTAMNIQHIESLNNIVEQIVDFEFEVILGEDHSTDDTARIVKKYADAYPKLIKTIIKLAELKILTLF